MIHDTPLIATIVAGIGLAFVLGTLAHRFKLPPLIGYLLAGILVGPNTPGFVADQALASELAEIGVILLMFGVGLHFSLKDLLSVRAIAIPGAVVQIGAGTLMGAGIGWWLGWTLAAGIVFGLALSVASTVVLLRALQERRLIETERGRIAVGWLIVEDLAMVMALVLLPAMAGMLGGESVSSQDWMARQLDLGVAGIVVLTILKVAAFVALMLIVGRRAIPWVLHYVAHSGSRELFRLAVLAIALGVAFGAAQLFGVSLALGAFFAGMIMSESELSQRAAEESLPLRDAFSVLFFVSVGMLFDPLSLMTDLIPLAATLAVVLFGKSLAAFLIVVAFRHPVGTALLIAASLAQIGEFSFILAELGVSLGILPERARDLILAGALISIMLNPLVFVLGKWIKTALERESQAPADSQASGNLVKEPLKPTVQTGHTVLVGFGRVGSRVGEALHAAGVPLLVIEDAEAPLAHLKNQPIETLSGNAADPEVLGAANLRQAKRLIIATPNAFEAGQIAMQARAANPSIGIIARAHSDAEVDHLRGLGADTIILGENELAKGMVAAIKLADA